MKYFLYRIKGEIKKPSQIKTKQISKRGKIAPQKRWGSSLKGFSLEEFFLLLFFNKREKVKESIRTIINH